MGAQMTGNWRGASERFAAFGGFIRGELAAAQARGGEIMVQYIRAEMQSTVAPALHPYTVMQKGNDKPLSDGPMEESITSKVSPNGLTVWAGVPEGPLVVAARANEYGAVIDVTERMRGYLHAHGLHLAGDTLTVVLPARPFIRPGILRAKPEIAREIRRGLREASRRTKGGR